MDVSTSIARHSRVQSSTMVRQQATSADETVSYEVHRPAHIGTGRLGQRLALEDADAFALAPPHRQASIAVKTIDALTVDLPAFAPQNADTHVDSHSGA